VSVPGPELVPSPAPAPGRADAAGAGAPSAAPEAIAAAVDAPAGASDDSASQAASPLIDQGAATPASVRDRTVSAAAVATAVDAAHVWNTTTKAAAQSSVGAALTTQKGAVATAGAVARWGRRMVSSF